MHLILHNDLIGEAAKTVQSPTEYTGLNPGDVLVSLKTMEKVKEYLELSEIKPLKCYSK